MKRSVLVGAIMAFLPLYVSAQSVAPFVMPSARMAALGGLHAANSAGLDAIFENPAGFASERSEFGAAAIVIDAAGPIFDIAGMLVGGLGNPIAALPSLLDDKGRLFVQVDILAPFSFGYVGKGLGFGVFNRSVATLNASSLLSVTYAITEEILLAGGYAHRFNLTDRQTLDLGIMPKGFIRAGMGQRASLTDVMALITAPDSILSDSDFIMTSGLGFDVGLRWCLDDAFALGLVARDAFSPAMVTTYYSFNDFTANPQAAKKGAVYALVPADLSVGLAWDIQAAFLDMLGADVLVLVDYNDILDLLSTIPRNPILNVGLGIELKLFEVLSLRAGIKDALPTAGLGIDLSLFTFSLAMYGEELGIEPGARPAFNLLVALDFKY